ncbi:MAG: aminotransferase class V-fold PLP-dependent enzyme [Rhizobiaceae bacterium]|nr:aminotransferase class V-fold PLP-dependent enzyme [Rhizobiaceae bacterium]
MIKNTNGKTGLFIPGPTNIPDTVRQAMNVPMQDMRAPDFGDLTLPLFADLKKVFKTETAEVFMFPGSGTAGWESCIGNLFSPGDRVLMSSFGQFSMLWVDMAERFGLNVDHCEVEWGLGVPLQQYREILEADKNHEIKGVFACHNETATGVTSDISAIRQILNDLDHPALLCVDGVSSVAAIDFRMDEWGVDVVVSGSQKGFMLPTGLAIVAVSQKALEMRGRATLPRTFLSYDDMMKTNVTGHFPYTPATQLFHGLRSSLDFIFDEGLENVFARHHRLASAVRAGVHAWGLQLCARDPEIYSDTVSAILVPEGFDSGEVLKTAYYKYNMSLGAGLNKVAGRVFRIGHLGDLNEIMVLQALAGSEMALRDCGINIELGSGVAAAQETFIDAAPQLHTIAA